MWLEALVWILRVVLVLVCLLMVLVILMQRSKQEGLGAAFGAGMTESVFGADTSNILSKTTVWCAVLFFSITLALTAISSHKTRTGGSRLQQAAEEAAKGLAPAPGATNAAPAGTNAPAVAPAPAAKAAAPAPAAKAPAAAPAPAPKPSAAPVPAK